MLKKVFKKHLFAGKYIRARHAGDSRRHRHRDPRPGPAASLAGAPCGQTPTRADWNRLAAGRALPGRQFVTHGGRGAGVRVTGSRPVARPASRRLCHVTMRVFHLPTMQTLACVNTPQSRST